ncbi:MAG: TRAP transporter small permease [Lachnospirales bacterium]
MRKIIDNFEEYIAALLFATMFIVLILQIIFRQIIEVPLIWSEELSTFLFVYVGMLGIVIGVKHTQHVAIDIIYSRFLGGAKKVVDVLLSVVVIITLVTLTYIGIVVTKNKASLEILTLGISSAFMYMALPIGTTLMLIRFIENIVKGKKLF